MTTRWNTGGRYRGPFPEPVKRWARHNLPHHCNHCGRDDLSLTLDHIINRAEGGTDDRTNAQWLCSPCHDRKTAQERARGQQRRRNRATRIRTHPGRA